MMYNDAVNIWPQLSDQNLSRLKWGFWRAEEKEEYRNVR